MTFEWALPAQVETGFNVNVAPGWKFTHNVFSANKNIFGQNINRYSFTPGVLFELGAVDVKKFTTNYTILADRKDLAFSTGFYFMFGFNNVNIGYSFGWDFLLTDARKDWYYNGERWNGITVGFDIIK